MKNFLVKLRRVASALVAAQWAMPKTQYAWIGFEFLLLLLGFLFVGICALSLIAIVGICVALLPQPDSPTAIFAYFCILAATARIMGKEAVEIVSIALGVLSEMTLRVISVVVVGWSEAAGQTRAGIQLRYIALFLVTTTLAIFYCRYEFQSELPYLSMLALMKNSAANFTVWSAVWLSTKLAFSAYILSLPIRLLFSRQWNAVLQRGEFKPASVLTLSPLGGTTRASLATPGSHLISHLSDLHVGGNAKELGLAATLERHARGLNQLFDAVAHDHPSSVLITGDVTDSGSEEQWKTFLATAQKSPLADKMILAPGNHDLNIVFEGVEAVTKFEEISRRGDNERAVSYLEAADAIMGERAEVICPFTGTRTTLREAFKRARPDVDHKMNRTGPRDVIAPVDLLDKLFPMLVRVGDGPAVMVWNSVKRNRWPVFNAIGRIGNAQVTRAQSLVDGHPASVPLLHMSHHQIAVPPRSECQSKQGGLTWNWFFSAWMSVEDPMTLLNWLRKRRQKTVLLHGHHHKFFLREAVTDDLTLVSTPSATVGCEESYDSACTAGPKGKWLSVEVVTDGPDAVINLVQVRELA